MQKTLSSEWRAYDQTLAESNATPAQRAVMSHAFHAGALAMYGLIFRLGMEGASDAEASHAIKRYGDDLAAFFKRFQEAANR